MFHPVDIHNAALLDRNIKVVYRYDTEEYISYHIKRIDSAIIPTKIKSTKECVISSSK
jgi:hypothetical protein